MKKFTRKELARYNGKDGAPAYVACEGEVYDVSKSVLWRKGEHQVTHNAGQDLTDSIKEAPHGPDLLKKFPLVGILEES
ncbi:MAG TPA: cytochrome B5 [Thermoplasmata archaeon]|nr:cytochrome B5 [Thermoplasmata archaeon]